MDCFQVTRRYQAKKLSNDGTRGGLKSWLVAGTEAPDHQVGRQLVDPAGVQWVGTLAGAPLLLGTMAGALWGSARLQPPVQRGPASVNLISTFVGIIF